MRKRDSLLQQGRGKLARSETLLSQGTTKMGPVIHAFNLPAVTTCPGISSACEVCYARKHRWQFANVRKSLRRNLRASRGKTFSDRMIKEIRRRNIRLVRIHASGDFYSVEYIRAWSRVLENCSQTSFYAYTRSWRIPGLCEALEELGKWSTFQLWYSADQDTGMPPDLPEGVRVAWLQCSVDEEVPPDVDLIFRNYPLRKLPAGRVPLALICPVENGRTESRTDCGRCARCWS